MTLDYKVVKTKSFLEKKNISVKFCNPKFVLTK